MTTPAVSVLVTAYRHARFVDEALDSLRAQGMRDVEVLITDDASGDETPELIEAWLRRTGFPARFIRNPVNRGICAVRNAALAQTTGRFVCSLATDDVYEPDRLARQLAAFADLPEEVAVVYSDTSLIDPDGRLVGESFLAEHLARWRTRPHPDDMFLTLLLGGNFLPAPGVMIRRSALEAVGPYDESLYYEDYDMWLRLSHRFRFHHLPGSVTRYRVVGNSMSRGVATRSPMREAEFAILLKWLGRCGAAEAELRDRIWFFACRELLLGDAAAGRRMMAQIARRDFGLRRRLAAGLATVPGGETAFRRLAAPYARAFGVDSIAAAG